MCQVSLVRDWFDVDVYLLASRPPSLGQLHKFVALPAVPTPPELRRTQRDAAPTAEVASVATCTETMEETMGKTAGSTEIEQIRPPPEWLCA